ncbi:hypothetical protein ACFSJS_22690 [Streptomyces desertarenae]|uniref:SWIM-type domain-containing protein n=1 Tax=Streptomyces desertarenae TaxID=2666184 RepID=A0ABW4PSP5_9ACTN
MTHTRVHTYITFANPYLVCSACGQPVPRWHDDTKCGCAAGWWNDPCGHRADFDSVCPSWDPVDGCQCAEKLGHVPHPPAPQQQ